MCHYAWKGIIMSKHIVTTEPSLKFLGDLAKDIPGLGDLLERLEDTSNVAGFSKLLADLEDTAKLVLLSDCRINLEAFWEKMVGEYKAIREDESLYTIKTFENFTDALACLVKSTGEYSLKLMDDDLGNTKMSAKQAQKAFALYKKRDNHISFCLKFSYFLKELAEAIVSDFNQYSDDKIAKLMSGIKRRGTPYLYVVAK